MVQGAHFHRTSTEFSSLSSRLGMAFIWYLMVLITLIAFALKSACLEGGMAAPSQYVQLCCINSKYCSAYNLCFVPWFKISIFLPKVY